MAKTIVITGGTGGIGYQEALCLAGMPEKHTLVITGRREASAQKAVDAIKAETGNNNIHFALADMSVQSQVHALAKDLMERFPKIDELINNAGNLTTGEKKEQSIDGVEKNLAVNVIAPLLLTRDLVPALKAATPTGKVQITSGGAPTDDLDVADLESEKVTVPLLCYSHSKRIMEAMAVAFSRELESEGVVVNVVGGALPGATPMTSVISFSDLPWFMKLFYPVFALIMSDDDGKSAKKAGMPAVLAVAATGEELGTGKSYLSYPKEGQFRKEVAKKENQEAVMKFVEGKIIK